MNIQSIKYQTAASGAPFSASSFTAPAPNLIDGSVGDTSTGYAGLTTGALAVLIDMGAANLTAVNQIEAAYTTNCGGTQTLYYSSDGIAWNSAFSATSQFPGGTPQNLTTPQTARYWQYVLATSGAPSVPQLTDFRLYSGGAVVTTPPPAPAAPTAPSFGATTTGGTSLPVSTQALTANATSEVVQVTTDAAGTQQVAGSPFTVPSPGTAVSATGLTSGTTYYVSLGMVNSGGTTFGPSASIVFDTARPVPGTPSLGTDGLTLTVPWSDATLPILQVAGFGTSQGLTLTATGGAVTLSPVSTAIGITTATLSRPIQRGEILTLSGTAGAFTDSANAPNASAAFSGVAVTNSSALVPRSSYMARSTDLQGIYFGVEAPTAPGTAVLPVKRMLNLGLTTTPMIPNKGIKHAGSKATTDFQRGQEQSDTAYNSAADYNLLAYVLSSVLGYQGPPTTIGGGAYQWTWLVSPTAPLPAPATFTVDQGSLRGMERFTCGVFSGTTFKWAMDTAELSGNMFGQQVIRNASPLSALATAPGSIVDIAPAAIDPITIGAYLSLDGGVTFNRMQKDIDGDLRMMGVWGPNYHVSDLNPSFDDIKELTPDMGLTLTVEEGTEADTFMSRLYAGQPLHAGVKSVGPVIGVVGGMNINYLLKANLPVFASKPAPGDKNGVYGNTFTFDVAHDSTFGMVQVTLINKLSQL